MNTSSTKTVISLTSRIQVYRFFIKKNVVPYKEKSTFYIQICKFGPRLQSSLYIFALFHLQKIRFCNIPLSSHIKIKFRVKQKSLIIYQAANKNFCLFFLYQPISAANRRPFYAFCFFIRIAVNQKEHTCNLCGYINYMHTFSYKHLNVLL